MVATLTSSILATDFTLYNLRSVYSILTPIKKPPILGGLLVSVSAYFFKVIALCVYRFPPLKCIATLAKADLEAYRMVAHFQYL